MKKHIRRAYATVIVLLFLTVAMVLAASLYASLTMNVAGVRNDMGGARATTAAESALSFLMYEVCTLTKAAPSKTQDIVGYMQHVEQLLNDVLPNSTEPVDASDSTKGFKIPATNLSDNRQFQAVFENDGTDGLKLTIIGTARLQSGDQTVVPRASREIGITFKREAQYGFSALNYGVAAKSGISLDGGATIYQASDGTTRTYDSNDPGQVLPISVSGYPSASVLKFADSPDPTGQKFYFPAFSQQLYDTLDSLKITTSNPGGTLARANLTNATAWNNVYIPANSGTVSAPAQIDGVVYVEWPNTLVFDKNTVVNGLIVYGKASGSTQPGGSTIELGRTVTYTHTPATTAQLQAVFGQSYSSLANDLIADASASAGWCIIAPDAICEIPNGANKGAQKTFNGSVSAYSIDWVGQGNSGDIDILIQNGSLLTETYVRFGGNRVLCINPAFRGTALKAFSGYSLAAKRYTYWEKVVQ